jgi:hypothetical protein
MQTNIVKSSRLTSILSFAFAGLLKQRLADLIPQKQAQLAEIKKKYGNEVLGQITVGQVIGGMRGVKGLFYDGSLLDPQSVSTPSSIHLLRESHSENTTFQMSRSTSTKQMVGTNHFLSHSTGSS